MKIYTKAGDRGKTTLFGGEKVTKAHARLHAYGTLDELNAILALFLSEDVEEGIQKQITDIQHTLFFVSSDLATPLTSIAPIHRTTTEESEVLEHWIDAYEAHLPPLQTFIMPGGSKASSLLHLARTVCRRAERWIVTIQEEEDINPSTLIYINRLSDYLFVLARYVNASKNIPDTEVRLKRS